MTNNMKLWDAVCKTDPANTKPANLGGNKVTSIDPQSQIMEATKQFGPYGSSWGLENSSFDYSLKEFGIVVFETTFYYPDIKEDNSIVLASFPIKNSVKLYKDNAKTKIDDDFAKKVETDTLTKALSKIGFNADIFLGKFDDLRYVEEVKNEFEQKKNNEFEQKKNNDCSEVQAILKMIQENNIQAIQKNWQGMIAAYWTKLEPATHEALNGIINPPLKSVSTQG